jgi:hypothetical protein
MPTDEEKEPGMRVIASSTERSVTRALGAASPSTARTCRCL